MDHHLRTFVTVVEYKNFTRAAEILHITQSAVTLSVKTLEKSYQVKLLERTNKYVRLTKAGEILYHHAKEILAKYDHVKRLIDDLSHQASGPLSIGSSYTFGEYILPKLISNFKRKFPQVTPNITIRNTEAIVTQLLRHELDLGIVEGRVDHPDLLVRPFAKDELVVVVPADHPCSKKKIIELQDFKDETWILREKGSGTRQSVEDVFAELDFSPNSTMSFGSSQIIKESVEAGLGVSILSESIIRKELLLGTMIGLRIKGFPMIRDFSYVIYDSEFRPRSTDLFLEHLSQFSPLI
ncbi:LysR family transcriptional regulator [Ammoniphilus sp. YIM 78166]|uniref:LysR family transcriptional regulator n=1 Tax=Ammoniphilus sp. YIM 78166 TaxID=1644106 RepID=UPI00106F97C6|nr:LysR family transcriptional regulator [Ammoniphilus sp. YIM 78166]